jgi:hypothetical protein
MADTQNITGMDALFQALQELPQKLEQKYLRKAVASAGVVIRNEARNRAPVYTGPAEQGHPPPGTLQRAISYGRNNRDCAKGKEVGHVFVRQAKNGSKGQKGVKAYGKFDAYYALWVEYGHWTRSPNRASGRKAARAGHTLKFVPASPYMRPAWEAKGQAALDALKESLAQSVEDAANEARK